MATTSFSTLLGLRTPKSINMDNSERKGPAKATNNSSDTATSPDSNSLNITRPKRFLTAYNFFFMHERAALLNADGAADSESSLPMGTSNQVGLTSSKPWTQKKKRAHVKTHGKIEFGSLGKLVAAKWKTLSAEDRKVYEDLAKEDLERYRREREEYKRKVVLMIEQKEAAEDSSEESEEEEPVHNEKSITKPCHDTCQMEGLKPPDQAKSNVNRASISERKLSHSKKRTSNTSGTCDLIASSSAPASCTPPKIISPHPANGECAFKNNDGGKKSKVYFSFPTNKLYERDQHVSMIMDVYGRLVQSKSSTEMVMISGYSGAGKSALVHYVSKLMTQMGGRFLSGKFHQFRQMEPLSAVIDALTEFCSNVSRSDAIKLQETVGADVDILANVIPTFRQIFQTTRTSTSTVGNISAEEAHYRLKFAFRRFFRAITPPNQPLVLFLDDLQWADLLSLDLVETLMADKENKSFFFIGCYRNNEVDETHPLIARLRNIENNQVTATNIHLGNLSRESINELISGTLNTPPKLTQPLSCAVHRKTNGNVLFVLEFIRSIYDDGMLYFHNHSKQWRWDISTIESKKVADNVVELMLRKILHFPNETQYVLKVMACMGSECEEWILHEIMVEHGICDAEHVGFIAQLELAVQEGLVDFTGSSYKFAHDHFQSAAYSLIPENARGQLHLWIGSKVWAHRAASPEKALFIAVGQLNKGATLITDTNRRMHVAKLNLQAGEKSMSLTAFVPAVFYLKMAISLLNENSWSDHYDLCLQLYSSYAEAKYCSGGFEDLNKILFQIFTNAKCDLDKVRAYRTSISAFIAQGKVKEALNNGVHALSQIGEPTPMHGDKKMLIMVEFVKANQLMKEKDDSELLALRDMKDEHKIAAMDVMNILALTSFFSDKEMYALFILRMVQISLKYGLCKESAFAFASYGALIHGMLSDISRAYRFGQLSLRLLEKSQATECLPAVYLLVYSMINSLVNHPRLNMKPLEQAYKVGMQCGKCNYAMSALVQNCIFSFFCGETLATVEKKLKDSSEEMMEHNQKMFRIMLLPLRQTCLNLMGRSDDPEELTGEAMNQDQLMKNALENSNLRLVTQIYRFRRWLAYLFGNYESASKLLEEQQAPEVRVPATKCHELMINGLISFAIAHKKDQLKWSALGKNSMEELEKYAFHAPSNYNHMLFLLRAESAFLGGEHDDARRNYDEAIKIAFENGFIHDVALAYERAGIFYSSNGKSDTACVYYRQAHDAYKKWGAHCKADHIRQQYTF